MMFFFVFRPHKRSQNVDHIIHTRYLVVIVCEILGKKNYVGNDIFRTQQCHQIQIDKKKLFIYRLQD